MPLPRRSVYVSPEILTPFGWMSLPDAGPMDDVSHSKAGGATEEPRR